MAGYRKTPKFLVEKIMHLDADNFVVCTSRSYGLDELEGGAAAHLGVFVEHGQVMHGDPVLLPVDGGIWARRNIEGEAHVRRDLDKVNKLIGGWLVPNFGSWDKGSHVHWGTRKVFQRERWYGHEIRVAVDAIKPLADEAKVTIVFRADRAFDRTAYDDRDLHLVASLLKEATDRDVTVRPASSTAEEWLADQRLAWELLPIGESDAARVAEGLGISADSPRRGVFEDRFQAVTDLKPESVLVGTGRFSRYVGFKFADDLVVLENMNYGNALYVMYRDWPELSQRSRVALLADPDANYDRVLHTKGWEERLKMLISRALDE